MKDGKHVVLYVEDDKDFRDSMRTVLEANGYIMVEAASGDEGLKVFKRESPDLAIVDLMMEEVDAGTALVRDLRAINASIPIFMLSSVGDDLARSADYGELGLSGVLQKPLEFNSILSLLKSKLG